MRAALSLSLLVTGSVVLAIKPQLQQRDASTVISGGQTTLGEDHNPLNIPKGARIKNIPVGNGGEEVAVYWNEPRSEQSSTATNAYVMIHGRLRDGNHYWEIMNDALQHAVQAGYPDVDEMAIVAAPQFFSTILNEGQYEDQQLAWGDVNGWQAGDPATHPQGTARTSFDALDVILANFANKNEFPSIANITVVGHGGGGQMITRYAAVATIPDNVHVRFIVGDASTHAYFTDHRPVTMDVGGDGCEFWNTWRYGFENFTGTASGLRTVEEYFHQYIERDIVILVGQDDTEEGGDQYCPALMQGGVARRDRNYAWWGYINTLARTSEPVELFQKADFNHNLPDWSRGSKTFRPRLVIVEDVGHSGEEVFSSSEGRAALFSNGEIPRGWRPNGYDGRATDCSYCLDGEVKLQSVSVLSSRAPSSNAAQPSATAQSSNNSPNSNAPNTPSSAQSNIINIPFQSFLTLTGLLSGFIMA